MSIYTVADVIAKRSVGSDRATERIAVVAGGEATTYGELEDRVERLAAGLAEAGLNPGDAVCVLMHNRVEWLELFFALARLGGVVVPVNHLLTSREIGFLVEDSGARWFVAEDGLWGKLEGLELERAPPTGIVVGEEREGGTPYERLFGAGRLCERPAVSVADRLLLQYTSGTTGFPKGAIHTHSTVLWNAISQRQHFSVDADTVYLCLPALSWVAGLHSLLMETLWSGGTVVLNPTDLPFDPASFCAAVEEQGVSHVALVPTVMRRVLALPQLDDRDLSSLRVVITGGEPVPVHLMEEMTQRLPTLALFQVYGMSEFPSLVTLLEPRHAVAKAGSAGRANCVSQIRVVDEHDRDLPPGEIGEVLTRSPATMLGYHARPEATEQALRGGWLHTGDLGHLDVDGYLFLSGRAKDLIISGGLNVYPAEIELALSRHSAVAEAAVLGRPDDAWGEVITAIVVLDQAGAATEQDLCEYLADQIAKYKIPRVWELRTGPPLPRTASGKLQKYKLEAPASQPTGGPR